MKDVHTSHPPPDNCTSYMCTSGLIFFRNELESEGELESLLEESSLPLHNLLTRYNVPELDDSGPVEKGKPVSTYCAIISLVLL